MAQTVTYSSITTQDGLPSNMVYQIKQDKKGFIWIATANGLARYDGRNFKLFNPEGIKDKDILGFHIDNQDNIWFWNLKGQLFLIENGKATFFPMDGKRVINFIQDKRDVYWFIAGKTGLYQLDKATKSSKLIHKGYSLRFLLTDGEQMLTGYGASRFIYENDKFVSKFYVTGNIPKNNFVLDKFHYTIINNKKFTIHNPDNKIIKLDDNNVFESRPFEAYEAGLDGVLFDIYQDKQGVYWLITTSNIYVFDNKFRPLNDNKPIVSNESSNYYFNDREGNHWVAIKNKGIRIIPSLDFTIDKSQMNIPSVSSLFVNNNDLLIGTDKGKLIIKNLKTNQLIIKKYNDDFNLKNIAKAAKDGDIWLATSNQAILLENNYQQETNNIGRNIINYKTIWNKDATEPLLIGDYAGVLRIPPNKLTYFKQINKTADDIGWGKLRKMFAIKGLKKRVYSIEKVKDEYWFGTPDGLYYYDGDSIILTEIDVLKKSWINQIINRNNTIWIGTQTDGLFKIVNKKIVEHYDKNKGLISNSCKKVLIEDNGIVWIGTNKGINKIDSKTNNIELINNLDGLLNNDINDLAMYQNKVFVGTSDGLMSFNKDILTQNSVAPPIYLSKFQIYEKDTILSNRYVLNHRQSNIHIHFTGISFRSQGTFKYQYRMKGISDVWTETQSNVASYPILNPGNYTFQAYAINEDGIKSAKPIEIEIIIKTPFWQTWWFYIALIMITLGIIWVIIKVREHRIKANLTIKNEFQQKINELEMQALQAQMNPHFIFNALNAIQHYMTLDNTEQAMIYLAKFAKLIRMIFDFSKIKTIPLSQEIVFLELYLQLEKLRFKDKVDINFKVDEDIYTDAIYIPPLLIQPMLENAFKHGFLHKKGVGKLIINFHQTPETVYCTVEDNGIGREKAKKIKSWKEKKHKSAGLETTKERLFLWLSKSSDISEFTPFKIIDLKDKNGEALGTKVEILLKIFPEH